jgi:hypothetical protein
MDLNFEGFVVFASADSKLENQKIVEKYLLFCFGILASFVRGLRKKLHLFGLEFYADK